MRYLLIIFLIIFSIGASCQNNEECEISEKITEVPRPYYDCWGEKQEESRWICEYECCNGQFELTDLTFLRTSVNLYKIKTNHCGECNNDCNGNYCICEHWGCSCENE